MMHLQPGNQAILLVFKKGASSLCSTRPTEIILLSHGCPANGRSESHATQSWSGWRVGNKTGYTPKAFLNTNMPTFLKITNYYPGNLGIIIMPTFYGMMVYISGNFWDAGRPAKLPETRIVWIPR